MTTTPFSSVAAALLAHGYSPLPVAPGTKVPGRIAERGWKAMRGWTTFCATPATPNKIKSWSLYPGAGVCVALGRGIIALDIDREDLVEPLLAVLPPAVVAKQGRKGLTVFYRADTAAILSRNFKDADGGMIDILGHGKQSVIPPSIHPDTKLPYVWTTDRTLADTPPADLPLYTGEHDAAVLGVLRTRGWRGDERRAQPTPARLPQAVVPREARSGELEDLKAAALANLPAWVPSLGLRHIERKGAGYRSVAEWRPSNSSKALSAREKNVGIHPSGIKDFVTGEGFTAIDLVMRARDLGFREATSWLADRLGFNLSGPVVPNMLEGQARTAAVPKPVIKASYPDLRVPLDDAVSALRDAIGEAFAGFAQYHVEKNACDNQLAVGMFAMEPKVPAILLRSEMAVGKTTIVTNAIQAAFRAIPAGETLVYNVPRIELGDDIAKALGALDIDAKVLRGRDQPDPDNLPTTMCLNREAANDATRAGANVYESVCERKPKGETPIRCRYFERCGYLRQQKATPQVWIIPSNRLFSIAPEAIQQPYALLIDERFHTGATSAKADVLTLDEIKNAPLPRIIEDRPIVEATREKLLAVLRVHEDGHVTRQALVEGGMTAKEAHAAGKAEMRRWRDPGLRPDLSPRERKRRVDEALAGNKGIKGIAGLFHEIALFLEGDEPVVGRLMLTFDKKCKAQVIRHRRRRQVDRSEKPNGKWSVPTLMLDGTAPPAEVLALALGRPVEVRANVSAFWSPQGHVTQIIGAPESKAKLDASKYRALRVGLAA